MTSLLLLKTTEMHASYFLKIFRCLTAKKKKKSPHCNTNLRGILNHHEHLVNVRLHYNLLTCHTSDKVTFERLVI